MKLTNKLISFLHRVFDKDPSPFLALRLRYAGTAMTWKVDSARLTTVPVGGVGSAISVDLTQYTLGELVNYLASRPGYTVEYADNTELSLLGAAVLLDGSGDQDLSNGDHLYGYTNVLFSYMEANAVELEAAQVQVEQMLLQMSTVTASDVWLDELGGYYAVPRLQGELDTSYGLRIIAEVLRPRGNNVAIEAAITAYTGQTTKVTDVVVNSGLIPLFNEADNFNGAKFYNSVATYQYGLFDVEYGYDLINGGSITAFAQIVRDLVGRLRDAGTHLRALALTGPVLTDTAAAAPTDGAVSQVLVVSPALTETFTVPTEGTFATAGAMAVMTDTATGGTDTFGFSILPEYKYNAVRTFNGIITYSSGTGIATEYF